MKTFDINNFEDFNNIVINIQYGRIPFVGEQYQELYRGQAKDSYLLQPSIARHAQTSEDIEKIEKELIHEVKNIFLQNDDYKKYIYQREGANGFENEWRLLEQMQHWGLPTRLLDWSIDPKTALFFAIESNTPEISQFWVFKSPLNWSCDEHFEYDPYSGEISIISNSSFWIENGYEHKVAEQRRGIQSGKFIFQDFQKCTIPLEQQESVKDLIIKYTINPDSKQELLKRLKEENITKEKLYIRKDEELEQVLCKIKPNFEHFLQ